MSSRAELEAKLNEQAQKNISAMLDQLEIESKVDLTQLEKATQQLGESLLQSTLQEAVKYYEQAAGAETSCPDCGGQLHRRGQRIRHLVTQQGDIEVQRAYYTCRNCGQGHFPPR